jgi:hypothetical protein
MVLFGICNFHVGIVLPAIVFSSQHVIHNGRRTDGGGFFSLAKVLMRTIVPGRKTLEIRTSHLPYAICYDAYWFFLLVVVPWKRYVYLSLLCILR